MTANQELKRIARKHSWAFEEAVYDQKLIEANRIVSAGVNDCFQYLKEAYGSKREVLKMLGYLVIQQGTRRKSISAKRTTSSDTKGGGTRSAVSETVLARH